MSNHPEIIKAVKEILKLIETSEQIIKSGEKTSIVANVGDNEYIISEKNRESYEEQIEKIRSLNKEIKKNFKKGYFEKSFIHQIVRSYLENGEVKDNEINRFVNGLLAFRKRKFTVVTEIFGVKFEPGVDPFKIGGFSLYKLPDHRKFLESVFKGREDHFVLKEVQFSEYIIRCEVEAHHIEEANEKADTEFLRFERICKFIMAWFPPQFDIGIFNYRRSKMLKTRIISEDGDGIEKYRREGILPINVKDFLKKVRTFGLEDVWKFLKQKNISEMKKKLLLAMEWTGRAKDDFSLETKFLDVEIALEVLFSYQKDGLFTAGMGHRIAESIALLLGSTVENRIEIEKDVKKLLSKRGKIVHSGKNNVTEEDFRKLMNYILPIILRFFNEPRLQKIKNLEELNELLKKMKYS